MFHIHIHGCFSFTRSRLDLLQFTFIIFVRRYQLVRSMLPGIGQKISKANYRKCQTLAFRGGVAVPKGFVQQQPPSDYDSLADLHRFRPPSHLLPSYEDVDDRRPFVGLTPRASTTKPGGRHWVPTYVLYDRLHLRFDGYYVEELFNCGCTSQTVHTIKFTYFLEDDSIAVHEPVTPNSGRAQGKLVQRHKIVKEDGSHWHWKDLNVGIDVNIFGRRFRLINCTEWTREFLTSSGIQVNAPEELPEFQPPLSSASAEQDCGIVVRPKTVPIKKHPLKQFLENDGQVLTFGCVWDRRDDCYVTSSERLRPYILRYFLVDDTIQINDAEFESNRRRGFYGSTRSGEAVLLRRQKLPKEPRPILTSPADAVDIVFYDPQDFFLGNIISVHGRKFVLIDCDEFTKKFYRENYDVVDFTPVQLT